MLYQSALKHPIEEQEVLIFFLVPVYIYVYEVFSIINAAKSDFVPFPCISTVDWEQGSS